MKILPIIILSGGALLAFNAFSTKGAADKLQSKVNEVDFLGVDLVGFNPVLKAKVKLLHTNPTGTALKVKNVFLDLVTPSGNILAKIRQSDAKFTIPANSDIIHTLDLTSSGLNVVGELLNLVTGGGLPSVVKVVGYLTVNNFRVEYNEEYTLA